MEILTKQEITNILKDFKLETKTIREKLYGNIWTRKIKCYANCFAFGSFDFGDVYSSNCVIDNIEPETLLARDSYIYAITKTKKEAEKIREEFLQKENAEKERIWKEAQDSKINSIKNLYNCTEEQAKEIEWATFPLQKLRESNQMSNTEKVIVDNILRLIHILNK